MNTNMNVRVDQATRDILDRLVEDASVKSPHRTTTKSEIVREAIFALAELRLTGRK